MNYFDDESNVDNYFKMCEGYDGREVIEKLKEYQGEYVRLDYVERYTTFFWLGDTKYFITNVEKEDSPHFRK